MERKKRWCIGQYRLNNLRFLLLLHSNHVMVDMELCKLVWVYLIITFRPKQRLFPTWWCRHHLVSNQELLKTEMIFSSLIFVLMSSPKCSIPALQVITAVQSHKMFCPNAVAGGPKGQKVFRVCISIKMRSLLYCSLTIGIDRLRLATGLADFSIYVIVFYKYLLQKLRSILAIWCFKNKQTLFPLRTCDFSHKFYCGHIFV